MKLVIASLVCIFYASYSFANNSLCIAVNNFSAVPINVSTPNGGEDHIIQPKEKLILPEHEVSAACFENWGCDIFIIEMNDRIKNPHSLIIKKLVRGSRVIYGAEDLYYVNAKAEVPCVVDDTGATKINKQ